MATPLVMTKVLRPESREQLVVRERLFTALDRLLAPGRKLGLVAAPAGYGKTTLAVAWLAKRGRPAAWLSLDGGDNDPVLFLRYLVAALQQIDPGLGEATENLLSSPTPSLEVALTTLINDVVSRGEGLEPLVLVLDDLHEIENPEIHKALAFFLDHLPASLRLVFLTRSDPPIPLSRLRGRNLVVELRGDALRFTPVEAASFLNEVMGLNLMEEEIAGLEARTEGWVTGLQMASLSLQRRQDPTALLADLSGTHRYILDYLVEEVLAGQPPEVRSFLLHTSILNRLNAELCEAVLDDEQTVYGSFGDAESILAYLERANLFVVSLDAERNWYRYHRLFADLLRARAATALADDLPELHNRASQWYEDQGMLSEAANHALVTGDAARLAEIVAVHGVNLLRLGELRLLMQWFRALPDDYACIQENARLCVIHAWTLLLTGQGAALIPWLSKADRLLAARPDRDLSGHVAAIRAYLLQQQGDVGSAVEAAEKALAYLDPDNAAIRAVVHFVLGGAHVVTDEIEAARDAMARAARLGQQGANPHLTFSAINALAELQRALGDLDGAEATARSAVEQAADHRGDPLPIAAGVVSALADIAYERNDLDGALDYARRALDLTLQWGSGETTVHNHITLARVLLATGDLLAAQETLQMARDESETLAGTPLLRSSLRAAWGRLWLAHNDMAAVAAWLEKSQEEVIALQLDEPLVRIRADLFLGRLESAYDQIDHLLDRTNAAGLLPARAELLMLRARLHHKKGQEELTTTSLRKAINLAIPAGYVRRVVRHAGSLTQPLTSLFRNGDDPEGAAYAGEVLTALRNESGAGLRRRPPAAESSQPLIDPLSDRELEVLKLVAEGLTNRMIGEKLYIAESTVKSHLNSVYGKLDVRNRTQAVAEARRLELLESQG